MRKFNYGPVEFFVVAFEGDRPDPGVMDAIVDLAMSGTVRLLDMVIASRDGDSLRLLEVDEQSLFGGGPVASLDVKGLIAEEDVKESMEAVEAGLSIAVVALELVWAITLAERLAEVGGLVVRSERIPAPVVNELVETAVSLEG